jgi:hypothetical protein
MYVGMNVCVWLGSEGGREWVCLGSEGEHINKWRRVPLHSFPSLERMGVSRKRGRERVCVCRAASGKRVPKKRGFRRKEGSEEKRVPKSMRRIMASLSF